MRYQEYLSLMRINKPTGFFLLWIPTMWALFLSYKQLPPFSLLILFSCGALIMRSAGCIINDIADRHIDNKVVRTKNRPLTKGSISLFEAFVLLFILLFCACIILTKLPYECFLCSLIALFLSTLYPFCKRFFKAPQLILSLAFSMSIPMVFIASHQRLNQTMWILLGINILWIITYDTQYAIVDKADDLKIGVNSTAILFGKYDLLIISTFQIIFHALWLGIRQKTNHPKIFLCAWSIATIQLIYQFLLIKKRKESLCLKAFSSNAWYGFIMLLGLL